MTIDAGPFADRTGGGIAPPRQARDAEPSTIG